MNAQTKIEAVTMRTPFPAHQISKLPKATKAQNDAVKADFKKGIRCTICGGWHHPDVVHLDYVGHAALTDRLLDVDPDWSWEPVSFGPDGLPAFDRNGGLWIRLTVLGVTRLGYGDAEGKTGGNAVKEAIGDALRNAAMRFGAALDLWHKGDLHLEAEDEGATGHSQGESQGAVSQSAPKKTKGENWGGRYPTKTALWAACRLHHGELERIGERATFDDLEDYLTSPEYVDYVAIATERAPALLEGPPPESMPEFIPTFKLEQKARDLIALRGNVAADPEEVN